MLKFIFNIVILQNKLENILNIKTISHSQYSTK
jgi:hypothetical protein